ncbi:SDR family oxidoreductase [Nocardia jiangxiensis]|uniref:SDR family oxidoreductase n=1 Tax=Nocardia jiangxiensis TaxID=282685 RepID=A0ABW6SD25_9NOCA
MSKVWLITGASRGFGRQFALAALGRGDRVVATARDVETLHDLKAEYGNALVPLTLDVTDKSAAADVVATAVDGFGQLDVVVNNAGYGLFGAVEELSEDDIRAQMETNFFGALWVTQAALPQLRRQKSGHIVQISTIGGVAAFPRLGGYHASKWALEGMSEALAQEVAPFGIKVTLVEPGGYATDWAGSSAAHAAPIEAYEGLHAQMAAGSGRALSGDPEAAGPALLQIVDAEKPPLRVFFGTMPLKLIEGVYAQRLATWKEWERTSIAAQG